MFAGHEGFFEALTCWAATLLGKARLLKPLKNLEDNNYCTCTVAPALTTTSALVPSPLQSSPPASPELHTVLEALMYHSAATVRPRILRWASVARVG